MRLAATALSLLLLSPALVRAGDPAPFFADGFESGTTCAWSAPLWYDDFDGDDYGDELDAGEPPVCTATTLIPNRLDCDDTDANVNPAAQEVCNDIEDDCDGLLDADDPGLQLPPCDNQQGVCAGSQSPAPNCVSGFWQACADADYASQTSAYETSETLCDGLDNDCDGATDGDDPTLERPSCENQTGVCQGALKAPERCAGGTWDACTEVDFLLHTSAYESEETTCDFLDNDCDGLVDEGDC